MTDGDDNSPHTTFADLMEVVRNGDTTYFFRLSQYLLRLVERVVGIEDAETQESLSMIAEESGANFTR